MRFRWVTDPRRPAFLLQSCPDEWRRSRHSRVDPGRRSRCPVDCRRGGERHGHADSVPSPRRPAGPVLQGRWISTAQRTASTTLWNCSTAGRLQTRPGPTWGPSLFAGPSRAGLETVPVLADRTLPAPYPPYKMICPAAQRPPGSSSQRTPSWREMDSNSRFRARLVTVWSFRPSTVSWEGMRCTP